MPRTRSFQNVPAAVWQGELRRRGRAPSNGQNQPIWTPLPRSDGSPGPQFHAANSPAFILGYGGAAGGGKTDLALGLAATRHRRSILFRREYKQLAGIIDRSREILDGHGRFNGQDKIWRLPGGRLIQLGAMQHENDKRNFQGNPHDLYAFDEATEFLENQIRFAIGWCRTSDPNQRCRVLMMFNPPTTAEGEWIIRFFAPWLDANHPNPAEPGEIRWFATPRNCEEREVESGEPFEHDGELVQPTSRTFIPARLEDNPIYERSGYRSVLQSFPEPLRSQMLYGDFSIGLESDPWQVIPTAWVDAAMSRWRADAEPAALEAVYGLDVAHGGKDKTVAAKRKGNWFGALLKKTGKETPDGKTAAAAFMTIYEPGSRVNVDAIGYGASCQERLADAPPEGYGIAAEAINVGTASKHTDRSGKFKMRNQRAEMYWRLREALDPDGGDNLMLPPDPELKADLTAPKWKPTPSGIQIEEKADIAARIGRSPDCGDAVALAMLETRPAYLLPGVNPYQDERW